jgi:hypothetical protein
VAHKGTDTPFGKLRACPEPAEGAGFVRLPLTLTFDFDFVPILNLLLILILTGKGAAFSRAAKPSKK